MSTPSPDHLPTQTADPRRHRSTLHRFLKFKNWNGARPLPLLICVALGLILRFAVPRPATVPQKGWSLLAIFVATIAGLILTPLPIGSWVIVCLTVTVVTKTLTFAAAFTAFTNEVLWLVVFSFFMSRGFVKTGLADRVALVFVWFLGKTTLGLSYGLVLGELLISPGMPSTAARAGGIFLPIIKSLAMAVDSKPHDPSARKLGAYLIQCQNHCVNLSSALFLTAAAQNFLTLKFAESLGIKIENQWLNWFKLAFLPAVISILMNPIIIYTIYPPGLKHTPDAPAMAKQKLNQMGPIKKNEWIMMGVLFLTIGLWIAGQKLNMSDVVAAMTGLSVLLLFGVIDWHDCLSEKTAWDTMVWFGALVGMAVQLTELGVIKWISNSVVHFIPRFSLGPLGAFIILNLLYFFIHYLFASKTAHVSALYSAFLAMMLASKVPGFLATFVLAYNTNLFGALTHYSSGQAAIYYSAGYVELRHVFMLGITMAVVNLTIWGLFGAAWWKILGLY